MNHISVIVKPTLACNIRCKHCYHGHSDNGGSMPSSVLERMIRLASEEFETVWFIWHGGEPTLLPLKFYKNAIELQEKYFGKGTFRVSNTIQTNGILLDKRFAAFCKEKKINIGISYEGPCNDILRSRTEDVRKNIEMLSKGEHMFSVSATICKETNKDMRKIYDDSVKKGIALSTSPVIRSGSATQNMVPDPIEYAEASISLFDEWLSDKNADVPLMPHMQYVSSALGSPSPSDCAHSSCLMKWLSVYPNGDIYPCGKGCPSEYRLCSIDDVSHLSDAFRTDAMKELFVTAIERREKCMKECELFRYCNGGCSMDALSEGSMSSNGGNSCIIFKKVFTHILKTIGRIVSEKHDLSQYNKFVRDAVIGKLVNPGIPNV